MADTGRLFTAQEISEAAQAALENWDFDVEADNGKSVREIEAMKEALNFDAEYASKTWCEDGPMDLGSAFSDIYDWLYEFSINMSGLSELLSPGTDGGAKR